MSTAAEFRPGSKQSPGRGASSSSALAKIVLTSMDADGTKAGYDLEMTRAVAEAVNIPVVASGGAGSPEHLYEAFTKGMADAAVGGQHFPLQ